MSYIFKKRIINIITAVIIVFSFCAISYPLGGLLLVDIKKGDEWHYYKGISEPPDKWYYSDFIDSTWSQGSSGFGYGIGGHNTLLNDMKGNYKSIYVRKKFSIPNYKNINKIALSVVCDGPFVAYFNMIEAIRSNRKGHGDPLILTGFAHELETGANVLSIKCSQNDINSDSFSFIPQFQIFGK